MKNLFLFNIVSVVFFVSGCSGLHSIPPASYDENTPKNTIKVFFDQWGQVYPKRIDTNIDKVSFGFNYGFNIKMYMEQKGISYNAEKTYTELATEIKKKLKESGENSKLVFLIHGYNNSYKKASDSFAELKKILKPSKDIIYVEVFWDGLYKGKYTFPYPLFYWFDSMTYSNLAGQVGLRKLLNELDDGADINIITHSRGAGVAVSAFSDPKYDSAKYNCDPAKPFDKQKYQVCVPPFESVDKKQFARVNLIMIAPAIGRGHQIKQLKKNMPENSGVYIGFNDNDPALLKSMLKSNQFGDTSFGAVNDYYHSISNEVNIDKQWMQRVRYLGYHKHALNGYLNSTNDDTSCLFWAANLLDMKPRDCGLSRRGN